MPSITNIVLPDVEKAFGSIVFQPYATIIHHKDISLVIFYNDSDLRKAELFSQLYGDFILFRDQSYRFEKRQFGLLLLLARCKRRKTKTVCAVDFTAKNLSPFRSDT